KRGYRVPVRTPERALDLERRKKLRSQAHPAYRRRSATFSARRIFMSDWYVAVLRQHLQLLKQETAQAQRHGSRRAFNLLSPTYRCSLPVCLTSTSHTGSFNSTSSASTMATPCFNSG